MPHKTIRELQLSGGSISSPYRRLMQSMVTCASSTIESSVVANRQYKSTQRQMCSDTAFCVDFVLAGHDVLLNQTSDV